MHVILALDGSPESLAAVTELAKLPWKEKPKVTVVTALVDAPYDLVPNDAGIWLREAEKEAASKNYDTAKSILEKSCESMEHVIERKHPKSLILDAAKRHNANLIVLGARGHSAAYRTLLGSTADYVANHAKCSVMVVRADNKTLDGSEGFRVLVACDGSKESTEAYRQMCRFDWPREKTELQLAMLLEKPKLIPDDVDYDPRQMAESKAMLGELGTTGEIICDAKQVVRETRHVGNAICSMAEGENSTLVFIGGTGKSAVARFFLGSTSRYVLHHAHCSLWIARENQWS